jgi:ABC-2 type transport system permease protein
VGRLIAGELLKLRTSRMPLAMLAGMVGFALLSVIAGILTADRAAEQGQGFALATDEGVRNVVRSAGAGMFFVLVLGILGFTGEWRHKTITATFLVSPERGRVVVAKLAVHALAGLAFAALSSALTLAVALPWLAVKEVPLAGRGDDVALTVLGVLLASTLYGLVGVGVGALVRNQVAAVTVSLLWLLVVEGLLVGLLPSVGRWLPSGAATALTRASLTTGELLPMWAGGLLLTGYGLAFAALATRFTVRRDVT